jgi:PKD repeat protein
MKPKSINALNSKQKLTPRKRILILGFALYVTFILLSRIPYIAESGTRQLLEDNMEDSYQYNLVFNEDGRQSHYYVERFDSAYPGIINLEYFTEPHTLEVQISNIRSLSIYSKEVYYDEANDVFLKNPYLQSELYYVFDYFTEERDEFTVNVYSDVEIEELRFIDAPQPVEVYVDGVEWWLSSENIHYSFEDDNIVLTYVPQGQTSIVIYYKERLKPHALFTISEENTIQEDSKIYGFINQAIEFDASDSHDNDDGGSITKYTWNFGDDKKKTGVNVEHEYSSTGEYTVTLTVRDNSDLKDSISKNITIIRDENDKDDDGMDDSWELLWGLDPTRNDADEDKDRDKLSNKKEHDNDPQTRPDKNDTDDDGYSDYDEIMNHDTDPTDPTSKPREEKGKAEDNTLMILGIVAVVIIIIILVLLFLLLKKRKKKPEEEPVQPGPEGPDEGAIEEGGAVTPPPTEEVEKLPVKGPPTSAEFQPPPDIAAIEGEEYQPLELVEQPTEGEAVEPIVPEEEAMMEPGLEPPPSLTEPEVPTEEPFQMLEEGVSPDDLALEMESMKMPVEEGGIEAELSPELIQEGAPEMPMPEESEPVSEEQPTHEPTPEVTEEEGTLTVKDYVKKGALQFKNGNYSDAIIEWQKALDIEPDHPEIVESIQEAMKKLQEQNN